MSTWRFDLTELNGTPIGTVQNATDRELTRTLNGNATASFTIALSNERAAEITSRGADVMLKVYQDDELFFLGDCSSAEADVASDKKTLACVFTDPMGLRLRKRWVGASLAGYSHVDPVPASQILTELITQANARKDTGIRLGTIDTLYDMSVGTDSPWTYKPVAEGFTNLQESKVPYPLITPLDYAISDNLTGTGFVDGRADDQAHTWDFGGNGDDWAVAAGAGRYSQYPADGTQTAWAVNSATHSGPLLAGMEFWSTDRARTNSGIHFTFWVRLSGQTNSSVGSGNWLAVVASFDSTSGYYRLLKKNGVTPVQLGPTYSVDAGAGYYWAATTWYSLRLLIDEFGNYWVYNYLSPGSIGIGYPGISGQDDDLAVGGALASGTYAFGDAFFGTVPTGVEVGRGVRNVFLSDYTGPQSFDYEFVPSEPTADSGQSGVVGAGVKMWTLNVGEPQLGTTTTAVFEYGPTMKSYNHKFDRDGLITEAACFSPDGSTTDVRVSSDAAAEAARGLYQEVIPNNDVSDGQMRQSLSDLNVQVRKQARQIITFEPTSRAPVFGTDYSIGDYVIGRAIVDGVEHFSGTFRVDSVSIVIDDNGKETVSPSVVPT